MSVGGDKNINFTQKKEEEEEELQENPREKMSQCSLNHLIDTLTYTVCLVNIDQYILPDGGHDFGGCQKI